MRKIFHGIGMVCRVLFVSVLLIGHLVADLVGVLVCAIASEG